MLIKDCGSHVIHPDKVMDIETLARKFLTGSELSGYYPSFVAIGAGTKESFYKDFKFERELSRIYSLFKLKGWPVSNIIAIDYNRDICREWDKLGISVFCCRWSSYKTLERIRASLVRQNQKSPFIFLYANHFGRKKDIIHHQSWLRIFKPKIFAALYTMRSAFNLSMINKEMDKYKSYYPLRLDALNREGQDGIIRYGGLSMIVMKRNYHRLTGSKIN